MCVNVVIAVAVAVAVAVAFAVALEAGYPHLHTLEEVLSYLQSTDNLYA